MNSVHKSEVVKDNGLNPIFKLHCSFKIFCPNKAFVLFDVFDKDLVSSETLGRFAIPFPCIRSGYRVIPLLDHNLNTIKHCYLFAKIHVVKLNN